MAYRDDREALSLQVADLERENEELREQVAALHADAKRMRDEGHRARKESAARGCALCGGSLLPVAVFAGSNGTPIPLSMSTLRFGDPKGGFTRSAPLKYRVCSSCGFVHHFIDIEDPQATNVARELQIDVGGVHEPSSNDDGRSSE